MYTDENTLVIGTLLCKKKRIQHGSPGHDESTVEASLGRVGGGEQCEARRAHNTPQGGLHREKRRLRFSTWSRNDICRPDGKRRPTLCVGLSGTLWHCGYRQEQYVAHQMVLPIIVSISCTGVHR